MSQVVSFEELRKHRNERNAYNRWVEFYTEQTHEHLLEALVYEHENDFPLRRSPEMLDQLRHKALVQVLQDKAQTQFLKSFLAEIHEKSHN